MRSVRNFDDVNIVLREIMDKLDKLRTSNVDLTGRRIINAGPSQNPEDYVTRKELVELEKKLNEKIGSL